MQGAENIAPELDDYFAQLRKLPFVRDVRVLAKTTRTPHAQARRALGPRARTRRQT